MIDEITEGLKDQEESYKYLYIGNSESYHEIEDYE
jgi:hypothetical protein